MREIRPNNSGPPVPDIWSRTRRDRGRLANCNDACSRSANFGSARQPSWTTGPSYALPPVASPLVLTVVIRAISLNTCNGACASDARRRQSPLAGALGPPLRALVSAPMRASPLRPPVALVLLALALAGLLAGCGKGSTASSGATRTASSGFGAAPKARGGLGIATKNTTRLGGGDPASDAAAVAEAVYPGFTPATRPQAVVV